jgi:glycine betaine/proline transport system permease protein
MPDDTLIAAAAVDGLPRVPVGEWIDTGFDWLTDNFEPVFDAISTATKAGVTALSDLLLLPPPILFVVVLAALALLVRSAKFAVGSLLGLLLIVSMGLWTRAMETLALVLVATVIAVLIAIPVGIAAAKNDRISAAVRPVLDFMQTMPAFVYLVPAVTFFGIGLVPGIVTTIIFALPPGVRLTELGIRQVDAETVEAGHAFGTPPGQILRGIELPLARPTIMAGVNQVIMLALSMAVIAGLIGAGGLGGTVVTSISRLDVGLGFEGGISVVILAIYLDRLTASLGERGNKSWIRRARGLWPTRTVQPDDTTTSDEGAPVPVPAAPASRS